MDYRNLRSRYGPGFAGTAYRYGLHYDTSVSGRVHLTGLYLVAVAGIVAAQKNLGSHDFELTLGEDVWGLVGDSWEPAVPA